MKIMKMIAVLLLFTTLSSVSITEAQTPIQIMCDTTFDVGQTIRELPDVVYRTIFPEDDQPVQQIERITQAGTQILDIPLPPELIGKVYPRRISPDGRYLALIPDEHNVPFAIWKIGTPEIATVLLPDSDVDYLLDYIQPSSRQEKILTWVDNSHLLIQYFDLDYSGFDHVLAEKILTVVDTPFQIIDETRIDISYPSLTVPSPSSFPRTVFSPQNTYVTLVSTYIGQRYQIYDNTTEPTLVADFQNDDTKQLIGKPIWILDDQAFFVLYRISPGTSPVRFGVAQVNAQQGFQFDYSFQQELEATFGAGVSVNIPPIAMLNDTGTHFLLYIYVPIEQQAYLVYYELGTDNITAICDNAKPNSEYYVPIWGPNDNQFGYWHNGWIIAYDLDTGQGYRTDGGGFIGWISDPTD